MASRGQSWAGLLRRGKLERLLTALATIEERARHLEGFIRDYARFAKLPAPRREAIAWDRFLAQLHTQVEFVAEGSFDDHVGRFAVAQMEQGLFNLLKNANEAGAPAHEAKLENGREPGRGRGGQV